MKDSPLRLASGLVLIGAGSVWVLQGFNVAFAPESFMTNDKWWILWGASAIALGVIAVWTALRR